MQKYSKQVNTLKLGTRGSKLALWQADYCTRQLRDHGYEVEVIVIKTQGDRVQDLSFDKLEGKGFFTKEIEDALLDGKIDLAVHSMKDLPTTMDERLVVAGVSERANPADWLIIRPEVYQGDQVLHLPYQAKVGTSSARRKSQLVSIRKDLQCLDIRGNVPTRIAKLREGQFDAVVLAAAGITRLNLDLDDLSVIKLHPREFIPAPAQGVLAYQSRVDDIKSRQIISKLHEAKVAECTNIERSVMKLFDGGCHLPLGVYCEKDPLRNFRVWAAYAPSLTSPIRKSHLAYSTSEGLAEAIYNDLQNIS